MLNCLLYMNRAEMPPVRSFLHPYRLLISLNYIAEGELVIKSHLISKGYLHLDNSAFTIDSDGAVTLRTGDIYGYGEEQRLVWKGRKEDYIEVRHIFWFIANQWASTSYLDVLWLYL